MRMRAWRMSARHSEEKNHESPRKIFLLHFNVDLIPMVEEGFALNMHDSTPTPRLQVSGHT